MFRNGMPPAEGRLYKISLEAQEKFNRRYKRYEQFINEVSKRILSDFEQFKHILSQAVSVYLSNIQNKWFRNAGRLRAQNLLIKISNELSMFKLLTHLENMIEEGNEEKDSLKTFIFKAINQHFGNNRILKMYPQPVHNITEILNELITSLKKQIQISENYDLAISTESENEIELRQITR